MLYFYPILFLKDERRRQKRILEIGLSERLRAIFRTKSRILEIGSWERALMKILVLNETIQKARSVTANAKNKEQRTNYRGNPYATTLKETPNISIFMSVLKIVVLHRTIQNMQSITAKFAGGKGPWRIRFKFVKKILKVYQIKGASSFVIYLNALLRLYCCKLSWTDFWKRPPVRYTAKIWRNICN